ncbi:hypothetical protein HYX03_04585 [Candidatus Woesearchaeota archaeon]|nr:hypothetical protein [Candidatus Woesearchaeota archaeon]
MATACYPYETVAGPSVCIDPNPYSTIKEKKVCEVQNIALSNQGAPVAITKIDEEAFATKTQFKITIRNVGNGDVLTTYAAYNKCDPYGQESQTKIQREDVDRVRILSVKISNNPLTCGPFVDGNVKDTSGNIRIINGEGFVICELPSSAYSNKISAYTTPLSIRLSYGYRNTAEKKILIKKETSAGFGGAAETPITPTTESPTVPDYVRPRGGEET